jgi:hypothetical protein
VTGPRPIPPRPSSGARAGEAGERRVEPRPTSGERRTEPRPISGERRAVSAEKARADREQTPSPQRPWLDRHAVKFRWALGIALAVIAIRLVAPRPDGWRRWSDAAAALSDVEEARTAALLHYQAALRQWPAPGRPGVAPPAMLAYLPGSVSYTRPRYRLVWEYAADTTSGARVIGVSVLGDDPLLAQAMAARAPDGMPFIVSGRRFMALIASSTGR